ncbi:MAG: class III poly(R)-hydroxyalkanoic acid synthase subunit PhaC, partial [Stenotrophomonas nitritireducens]|nr:class III poly(R)-hydroxyalkanoic acid synthase subunit PhaC [Stenotrophomonas nitritireducens]
MKGPLGFGMDDLLQEALQLRRKLADGLKLLPDVEDVGYGATAREEVWSDGKVKLYRFIGAQPPSGQPPLLIVYALVNRPYMVDLQDGRSLVQKLLAAGQDVYVLDWGYPDRSERFLTLGDYLLRFVDGAVDHLRAQHGG